MQEIGSVGRPSARQRKRPSVYGIGFVALDVVRSSKRENIYAYAGGTCGNVLAILAYLGWEAHPIARLNGDTASERVKEDLRSVGVMLELAEIAPTISTPIVVQIIKRGAKGVSRHRFEWACPECGTVLPRFRPVPARAVGRIAASMRKPSVFFMDRVSRSALELAKIASERGALVYFEPSEITHPKMFKEAMQIAHIVKYSRDRLRSLGHQGRNPEVLVEIQTLGAQGLIYRSRLSREPGWVHLPPVPAPVLIDACGAGDWCTAGIVASLGSGGFAGLLSDVGSDLGSALRYGQTLAAWNCRFEGARGGMYRIKRPSFVRQVRAMLGASVAPRTGRSNGSDPLRTSSVASVACPACPTRHAGRTSQHT